MSMLKETRKLLRDKKRVETLEQIAVSAGVGLSWLQKLSGNGEVNPRYDQIERLHEYLNGKNDKARPHPKPTKAADLKSTRA